MFSSAIMAGRVGPLRLSVKPKTKKERKHPAVRRRIVFFEVLVCMMMEIILAMVWMYALIVR